MSEANHSLVPGEVPAEQFDLLLSGTSIRGAGVIAALRDHLMTGVSAKQACERHEVSPSQFSLRLKAIQEESERAGRLSPFYCKP